MASLADRLHLSEVFRLHPEPIALCSMPDGRFVDVNDAFARAIDMEREAIVGRSGVELGIWADLSARDSMIADLRRVGSAVIDDVELISHSGERRRATLSVQMHEIDGVAHALWVAHDLTDLRHAEDELRARTAELETLLKVATALSSSTSLADTLQLVAERAAKALGCPEAEVVEYDREQDELRVAALYLTRPTVYSSMVGELVTGREAEMDKQWLYGSQCVQECLSDPEVSPVTRELMLRWDDRTYLNVPLRFSGEPLGLLVLTEWEHERHFSSRERAFAMALGEQAAIAIHTARQFEQQEERNRRVRALLDASAALASGRDRGELMLELARVATAALEADYCSVFSYDPEAQTVTETAVYRGGDPSEPERVGRPYRIGHSVPLADDEYPIDVAALEAGELAVETLSDPSLDPASRESMEEQGEKTCLTVPLLSRGQVAGFFVVIHERAEHTFTSDELALARAITEQAGAAWERARLHEELEILATTDGLTELSNHRHFYERLAQEIKRADRAGTSLPMLMIDIDDFKSYNDRHGHQAGDEALRGIARILTRDVRQDLDVVARYGGEELVVLLPGTLDAPLVAERIRSHVESARFLTPQGDAGLTVSIGVSFYPQDAKDMDDLVARADAAMYTAKRLGKNRIQVASDL